MKQLKYNSATNVLRFELPSEWSAVDLTGVTMNVKNIDGTLLVDAQAVTLYTATTLDGDVARYANTITLDSGAGDVAKGNGLLIAGAGSQEVVRVKGYDSTTKVVQLEDITQNAYSDGANVYGLFCSTTLDTTDTDAFVLNMQLTIEWVPAGTGIPTRELCRLSKNATDLVNLRLRFSRLYPRAYKAFTDPLDRLDNMVFEAEESLKASLMLRRLDYDRIVDQSLTSLSIMVKMAYLWTFNGDEDIEDERTFLQSEDSKMYEILCALPIWTDNNQDDVQDENEINDHQHFFVRSW